MQDDETQTVPVAETAVAVQAQKIDDVSPVSPPEQPATPVGAATPGPVRDTAQMPKPATKPVEPAKNDAVATEKAVKQPSSTPIGAIVIAVIIFMLLAGAAVMAFQQGL